MWRPHGRTIPAFAGMTGETECFFESRLWTAEKPMSKKIFIWLLATILLTTASLAQGQQPSKIHRIGFLVVPTRSFVSARVETFR